MEISKFKSALLIFVVLALVSVAQMPVAYAIEGDQHVSVIIAWDEELASYAWLCGYSDPYDFLWLNVDIASGWLYDEFGICLEYCEANTATWDSDDSLESDSERFDEVVAETGYSYVSPLLIAVTCQDMWWILDGEKIDKTLGIMEHNTSEPDYGAMLIRFTPYCTDNIILHEISHYYHCEDHYKRELWNRYCVMQNAMNPETGRPVALDSHSWCYQCKEHITANKHLFGYEEKSMGPWFIVPEAQVIMMTNETEEI